MMEAPPGGGEEEETGHKEEDAWSNPVVCRHIRKVVVWNTQENGAPSRSEMHELEIILSNWRTCDLAFMLIAERVAFGHQTNRAIFIKSVDLLHSNLFKQLPSVHILNDINDVICPLRSENQALNKKLRFLRNFLRTKLKDYKPHPPTPAPVSPLPSQVVSPRPRLEEIINFISPQDPKQSTPSPSPSSPSPRTPSPSSANVSRNRDPPPGLINRPTNLPLSQPPSSFSVSSSSSLQHPHPLQHSHSLTTRNPRPEPSNYLPLKGAHTQRATVGGGVSGEGRRLGEEGGGGGGKRDGEEGEKRGKGEEGGEREGEGERGEGERGEEGEGKEVEVGGGERGEVGKRHRGEVGGGGGGASVGGVQGGGGGSGGATTTTTTTTTTTPTTTAITTTATTTATTGGGGREAGIFVPNFLLHRCGTKVFEVEPVGACKSFSRMYGGGGKGAGGRLSAGGGRRPLDKKLFAAETDFYLHHVDPRTYDEQVRCVEQDKKRQREKSRPERQPQVKLFQYKHYCNQAKLLLTPEQLEELFAAVMSPKAEKRLVASKILMKFFVDMFATNPQNASTTLHTLVCRMLGYRLGEGGVVEGGGGMGVGVGTGKFVCLNSPLGRKREEGEREEMGGHARSHSRSRSDGGFPKEGKEGERGRNEREKSSQKSKRASLGLGKGGAGEAGEVGEAGRKEDGGRKDSLKKEGAKKGGAHELGKKRDGKEDMENVGGKEDEGLTARTGGASGKKGEKETEKLGVEKDVAGGGEKDSKKDEKKKRKIHIRSKKEDKKKKGKHGEDETGGTGGGEGEEQATKANASKKRVRSISSKKRSDKLIKPEKGVAELRLDSERRGGAAQPDGAEEDLDSFSGKRFLVNISKPASIDQVQKNPSQSSSKSGSFPEFPTKQPLPGETQGGSASPLSVSGGHGGETTGEEKGSPHSRPHTSRQVIGAASPRSPPSTPTTPTPPGALSRSKPRMVPSPSGTQFSNSPPKTSPSSFRCSPIPPSTSPSISATSSFSSTTPRSISPFFRNSILSSPSTTPVEPPPEPIISRNPQPLFVRLHGLNIIFNLCIHANMISPILASSPSSPPSSSSTSSSSAQETGGNMEQTFRMLAHLRHVLSQVIAVACHYREANSRVLEWMLKCFLALNTVNGVVLKNVLVGMTDSRFIPLCLDHLNTHNASLSQLLSLLLVNYVIPSSQAVSQNALLRVGGWRYIVQKYVETPSLKVRDNYFVVLYDLVYYNLVQEKVITTSKLDQEKSHFFLRLLRSVDFPQHATVLFKWIPKDVVQDVIQFLSRQHARLLRTSQPMVPPTLDTKFLAHLINSFVSLGRSYQHLTPNYHQLYKEIMKDRTGFDGKMDKLWKCMAFGTEMDILNSASVLFFLRYHKYEVSSSTKYEHVLRGVPKFCARLASSDMPQVRDILLRTTDRLLLALSFRLLDTWDEGMAKEICEVFNTDCVNVLGGTKGGQGVVGLVHLLFSFLINNAWDSLQSPQLRESLGDRDTIFRLVVLGKCAVNSRLLGYLKVETLCKLFQRLSSKRDGDMKTAVLVLIIRKCSTSTKDLSTVGFDYFRNLVESRHPEVALLASSFLIDQLQVHHPEQHKNLITRVLALAKETKDLALMDNQYLQIRAISTKDNNNNNNNS